MPVSTAERLGIVETKVANLDEKVDDIKVDIKDMHDCLDRTRDSLSDTLQTMRDESTSQHNSLSAKIEEIEKFKNKWMYTILGGAAVLGWVTGHMDVLAKFF